MKKYTDEELCAMINKHLGEELLCDKLAKIPLNDKIGFENAIGKRHLR